MAGSFFIAEFFRHKNGSWKVKIFINTYLSPKTENSNRVVVQLLGILKMVVVCTYTLEVWVLYSTYIWLLALSTFESRRWPHHTSRFWPSMNGFSRLPQMEISNLVINLGHDFVCYVYVYYCAVFVLDDMREALLHIQCNVYNWKWKDGEKPNSGVCTYIRTYVVVFVVLVSSLTQLTRILDT